MKNLDKIVELYDAHPGFLGSLNPLPEKMLNKIKEYEGKAMKLKDVVNELSVVANSLGGVVEDCKKYKFLIFKTQESNGVEHYYRLIRYNGSKK